MNWILARPAPMMPILDKMIEENIDITARAVIRKHSALKAASSITRSKERAAILTHYQNKQNELRHWQKRLSKTSKETVLRKLTEKDLKIGELEHQVEILTASHIAMISAVGELGGFSKWAKFFENYQDVIETLNKLNAIPSMDSSRND